MRTRFLVSFLFLFGAIDVHAQCDPALIVPSDGTAIPTPVIMSEINPGPSGYVEFFNPTGAAVSLTGWFLCSPFVYASLSGVTVPAGGYKTVGWPGTFGDDDSGGEVMLYDSSSFANSNDIIDYVCWGASNAFRLNQALSVGKWSGAHAPALVGGAIHRVTNTTGTDAASYDVTAAPSPRNCTPTSVGETPAYPSIAVSVTPNPFSALATIEFTLSSAADVSAEVYTVTGSRVRRLSPDLANHTGRILWDGTDDAGDELPSGTYFLRVSANSSTVTRRVTILR
jgi:hypothetical protein